VMPHSVLLPILSGVIHDNADPVLEKSPTCPLPAAIAFVQLQGAAGRLCRAPLVSFFEARAGRHLDQPVDERGAGRTASMAQVFKIIVRCPISHSNIDTGIRTTGRESLSSDIYEGGGMLCPDCHRFHSLRDEGFLSVADETLRQPVWRPNP
jgi:hypothetical protein